MSLLRGPRPRTAGRKGPRKAAAKRDWDSTVHDLTVHRATPEDILRRREIHKSKNKAMAHLELQEKALNRKLKKQKQLDANSLEKRKLALMCEILSDQYHLQDGQVMAVAKDLLGDAPRTRTGFPNVTMAPNCDLESSQGPIVQKSHPPSQLSILNESVMDSQALNEEEEEALLGEGYHDILGFKSSINSDRLLRLLREEDALVNSRLWVEKDMRKTSLPQESNVLQTPTTVSSSLDQSVKRKQAAQDSARQKRGDSPANLIQTDLQRDNKPSLDILNHMIQEVERELEEYEQSTGREVQRKERSEGLSGFTLSLVNALCRLMRYLKETEMQLHEKEMMSQQQEEMLNEHRELIDALTAEVLQVREENITMQKKLQQYMTVTDQKLMCLTQALKDLPLVEPQREQSPKHFGIASRGPTTNQEKPDFTYSEPGTDAGNRENTLKFPQEELPFTFHPQPGGSGDMRFGRSFPAHIFQPAVLLSPPQQKSSQGLSSLQNVFAAISQSTEREPCKERSLPSSLGTQSTTEKNCPIPQRQPTPPADENLESSHEKIHLSCPGDTGKNSTAEEFLQNGDLLGQIAELTQQNALIKAQLSKFRSVPGDKSDCLHQPDLIQNADPSPDSSQGQSHLMLSRSLEKRIAELNRQSTEARDKLLQLIDQQKSTASNMVPPMLSPFPTPSLNYTENARTTVEVPVPVAVAVDSSKNDSVPHASMTSMRRSIGDSSKPCSTLSAATESAKLTSVSQRPKVEKQKEEGWFALSVHVI
ncbi:PREDICTED: spindle and centriole-associated protein 1 isoform X4 [Ficedula albicollis]|uniref:spindle and centriole-associated protein 1 isoform X4 n=1 Tax=Ficedula albicollis TaxID=59894 RepID=UPI000359A183|nr:PREDICTED: spindle and centriole-associated protein 1 isoform X4 [Ficedula albicollis]